MSRTVGADVKNLNYDTLKEQKDSFRLLFL
jgi:hypothetical protein